MLLGPNQGRTFLHIVTTTTGGVLIGFDEAMTRDEECYFIPANNPLKLETYKGPIYALDVTALTSCTVYYFEE